MKPLVIYHGNCADGFTSAWLANMYFREEAGEDLGSDTWYVDAVPGTYGERPPAVRGREVYILDFSYDAENMDTIANLADSVVIIDHHESAIKKLSGRRWSNVKQVFDITKSGALLTAEYFWPDRDPGVMVKLVSDRDLWQFKDKRSKPFSMGLFSRPYTLENWDHASENIPELVSEGEAIERKHLKDIEELLMVTTRYENIGQDTVPCANMPYTMASDACNRLLELHPKAPFAATWYLRGDGRRVYSLRSRKTDDVNVATGAETYGGGGHRNASGFTA